MKFVHSLCLLGLLSMDPAAALADTPEGVTVSTEAELISAVSAATSGDVVLIADGTYHLGTTVTIAAGVTVKAKNGRNKVFFEPPETVVQLFVVNGGTLQDVTIQNFVKAPCLVKIQSSGFMIGCTLYNTSNAGSDTYGRGTVCCQLGTVSRCVFRSNKGGGTTCSPLSSTGTCVCENSLFVWNSSSYGGAINMHVGTWTLRNCTFIGNSSSARGSAVHNEGRSPNFYNCIIMDSAVCYGNTSCVKDGSSAAGKDTSTRSRYHNCLVGGFSRSDFVDYNPAACENVVDWPYPGFVSTAADDFHLLSDAPVIGKGVAVTYSDKANCDLDGTPRPATPSIGCYEYNSAYVPPHATLYVSKDGDNSDGSSWAKAFTSPQSALEIAPNGADVLVAAGEYAVTKELHVTNAVRFIGVAGRDQTTLRASAKGYRVVHIANARSLVKGFTIADGNCTDAGGGLIFYSASGGAGVGIAYVGGELQDCRITGCTDNGGAFGHYSSAIFADGGRISGCIIDNNTSKECAVTLMGTKTQYGYAQMDSCLIYDNTVAGPAVRLLTEVPWNSYTWTGADVELRNSTLFGNQTSKGAAVASVTRAIDGARVCNCLMLDGSDTVRAWGDSSASHATNATDVAWRNNATAITVGTNCLVGTKASLGVRTGGRLMWNSPCLDAGYAHIFATEPYARDVAGTNRVDAMPRRGKVDVGAYERPSVDATVLSVR